MKRKDYLIVALVPLALLLLPFTGQLTVEGWNWTWHDFLFAWVVFSVATFVFRLIVSRKFANLAYKAGAALAVLTGFLVFWVTAAVQIIGDENPANLLYLGVILIGLGGVGLARFQPRGMANAAYATAAAMFLVPVIGFLVAPADFSPGVVPVFFLNGCFVLMFVISGLLFRYSASQSSESSVATSA
jgi:hypothetical protein